MGNAWVGRAEGGVKKGRVVWVSGGRGGGLSGLGDGGDETIVSVESKGEKRGK